MFLKTGKSLLNAFQDIRKLYCEIIRKDLYDALFVVFATQFCLQFTDSALQEAKLELPVFYLPTLWLSESCVLMFELSLILCQCFIQHDAQLLLQLRALMIELFEELRLVAFKPSADCLILLRESAGEGIKPCNAFLLGTVEWRVCMLSTRKASDWLLLSPNIRWLVWTVLVIVHRGLSC